MHRRAGTVNDRPSVVLLSLAWLVTSIVLLCKPRMRVAGIVILVAPLALVVVAGVVWWSWAGTFTPALPPPHRPTQTVMIDPDQDSSPDHNVVVSQSTSIEGIEPAAPPGPATSIRADAILSILLAVLLLGGLVATVALLAFPKTRTAGAVMLAIGVPAVVLFLGFAFYLWRLDYVVQREWRPAPQVRLPTAIVSSSSPLHRETRAELVRGSENRKSPLTPQNKPTRNPRTPPPSREAERSPRRAARRPSRRRPPTRKPPRQTPTLRRRQRPRRKRLLGSTNRRDCSATRIK